MDIETFWSPVALHSPRISWKHSQHQKEENQGHSVCVFSKVHTTPYNVIKLTTKAILPAFHKRQWPTSATVCIFGAKDNSQQLKIIIKSRYQQL